MKWLPENGDSHEWHLVHGRWICGKCGLLSGFGPEWKPTASFFSCAEWKMKRALG